MTTVQKLLTAAILAAVGGTAIHEARQNSRLREENQLLEQQRALLVEQFQQLQHERDEATNRLALLTGESRSNSIAALPDEQFRELLRLRGTVGVLRRQLAEADKRTGAERPERQQSGLWLDANGNKLPALGDVPLVGELFRSQSNSIGGQGQGMAPQTLGAAMVKTNPAAAFAYSQQLNPSDRRLFLDSAFATLAQSDTEAALQWAEQRSSDPSDKEAAIKAIRSVAPVGIGAQLMQQDGYAVISRLLPGSPAEFSGQLHPGDRILAIAQGDNAFVDAHNLALSDLVQSIRGSPGTTVQLQIMSADAPPDSPPRTVTLSRDQIKFKR